MADIRSFFGSKTTGDNKGSTTKHSHEKTKEKKNVKVMDELSKKGHKNGVDGKKKKRILIESDSDEEPLPSNLRKKEKKVENDRSYEDRVSIQKKEKERLPSKVVEEEKVKPKKVVEHPKTALKKEMLNPTTPIDFFGSMEQPSTSVKRKKEKVAEKDEPPAKKEKSIGRDEPPSKIKRNVENSEIPIKKEKSIGRDEPPSKMKKNIENSDIPIKKEKSVAKDDASSKVKQKVEKTESPNKSGKKSSLASKLASKVSEGGIVNKSLGKEKIGENRKKESDSQKEKPRPCGPESKMKDALNDYINNAKEKEKHVKKEKSANLQKEAKTPPSKGKDLDSPKTPVEENATPKEKKGNSYWSYKSREGPAALGSKEIPIGSEDCLVGLTFVITGVLESFEREQFVDCIQRYGGKVTSAVSGKTSFLIVGREPGQSKITKAEKVGTKQIDEDGFIELVKSKSVGKIKKSSNTSPHSSSKTSKSLSPSKREQKNDEDRKKKKKSTDAVLNEVKPKFHQSEQKLKTSSSSSPISKIQNSPSLSSPKSTKGSPSSISNTQSPQLSSSQVGKVSSSLWVEKYKPKNMKQIVGQQGEKSNANKLKKWLLNWKDNNGKTKPKSSYMAGKEDGSIFKAAMLSGPPGVGKTTTATLVCKEVGFSFVEMNASDTRGKKALETEIKESLSNVTVDGMMQGQNDAGRNHVLIMDEVDGMAGNEDRGGMQELIQLIKKSQIPVICMCNDRNHQKVRSLANYCFDLRFYKPRVEQIKAFTLSVAAKENLKIPPQAMEQIVIGTNQDIRQVLHNLQMWTSTNNSMNYDDAKANAKNASKNIKIGNFDIIKKLYSISDSSKMSIDDRLELFFMDYSLVPLFMQENYLHVNPAKGSGSVKTTLDIISETADSIADGNLVESLVRGSQSWSLLPLHGLFSTGIPSMKMSGYLGQRIDFPQWLGKNSSRGKHDRILQELKTHMALSSDCMKTDINLEYMSVLKRLLTKPLTDTTLDPNDAAKKVISLMDSYNLTREDWDSITDIGKWGNEVDITSKIPTKVKSAFTRLYNKDTHKAPYAVHQVAKKAKAKTSMSDEVLMDEDEDAVVDDEDENDEDVSKDAMIKMKKEPKAGNSKSKSTTTKSKNRDEKAKKKKK